MQYLTNTHGLNIKKSGELSYLQIGEDGRNRVGKKIKVQCPIVDDFSLNRLSVDAPKPGRPGNVSLVPERSGDESGYVLNLVACGGYHRGRNDRVLVLSADLPKIVVLAQGQGRDGIAGNIGRWNQVLVTAQEGVLFRIKLDRSTSYLVVSKGKLSSYTVQEAELHGLEIDAEFTSLSIDA